MKKRILGILSILGMLLIGVLFLTSPFGRELRPDLDSASYIIFGIVGIVFGLVFHIAIGVIGGLLAIVFGTSLGEMPFLADLGFVYICMELIIILATNALIIVELIVDAPRYKKFFKYVESISTYKDGVLSITKRDAVFKTVIDIKPYYSSKVAYKPEQYVYTGATVGGITTGGVHKEGGYNYISSTHKTAKCELHYHGDKAKVIDKIQLTPALAEEARKCDQIKGFLNEKDQIAVKSNIPMSRMDSELFLYFGKSQSAGMYNITSKYAEMRAPSREKCEMIIEWLCGGEASKE